VCALAEENFFKKDFMKRMILARSVLFAAALLIFIVTTIHAQPQLTMSEQRPGSILLYNIFTSDVGNPAQQNTRLNVTNLADSSVLVHWFFIDNATCQPADTFTCLTAHQTLSLFASDYDPGVTGYAVAVAVDQNGLPRDFDFLIGSEYVKFISGHAANLVAEPVGIVTRPFVPTPVAGSGGSQVELVFDDVSYEKLPSALALNNIPSRADQNETMLIVNRIGGDLGEQVSTIGTLNGLLYNQAERGFSFILRAGGCQLVQILNDGFPRTSPAFSKVIPTGASGWMRFSTADTVDNRPQGTANDPRAILGAMINFHNTDPMLPVGFGKEFNQGHNLHRLTLAPVTKLRMPVIVPPGC
jgi:hypothetical protein